MKQLVWAAVLLLIISGCEQKNEEQAVQGAKAEKQAEVPLLQEAKAKETVGFKSGEKSEKESKLAKVGIETTPDGKIIIDTNRTKTYFRKLAEVMKKKMEKFSKEMEKGIIEEKEAGIEVSETHIEIDLNKTQTFLEKWSRKMEEFAKEFDKIANEINNTAKGY